MFNRFRHRLKVRAHSEVGAFWETYRQFLRWKSGYRVVLHGKENRLDIEPSTVSNFEVNVYGSRNTIVIRKGARVLDCRVHIVGDDNRVEIGEDVFLNKCLLWAMGGRSQILIASKASAEVTNVFASDSGSRVVIGEDCMIASLCEIRCGDGHTVYDRGSGEILNLGSYLEIGKHVWIATGATILKNVRIGEGSIVGARSIVTKDIPDHSLAAGIPARLIRREVGWRREAIFELPANWKQEAGVANG